MIVRVVKSDLVLQPGGLCPCREIRSLGRALRNWRAQPRSHPPPSTGMKHVWRIVFTLLVLLLAGALMYVLWPRTAGVHFAILPVTDSDVLAMPPIPYARDGANAMMDLQTRPAVLDLQEIQTAHGLATLAGKLKEGLEGGDTLVVYLTCHCVSDTGKDGPAAWLLCSDFLVGSDENGSATGKYRLRDVLLQLKGCQARTKLLILDSGYLNYDPRLGLFVNEFPRLLEAEVHAIDDPNLWVLCSCQPMEMSHVCGAAKRSVFNCFVMGAFTGAANPNKRWVELEDVFTYVRQGVANWVDHRSGGVETQTPWLAHRSGVDHPPHDLRSHLC